MLPQFQRLHGVILIQWESTREFYRFWGYRRWSYVNKSLKGSWCYHNYWIWKYQRWLLAIPGCVVSAMLYKMNDNRLCKMHVMLHQSHHQGFAQLACWQAAVHRLLAQSPRTLRLPGSSQDCRTDGSGPFGFELFRNSSNYWKQEVWSVTHLRCSQKCSQVMEFILCLWKW